MKKAIQKYDKLIRDKIEQIIKDNGENPVTHIEKGKKLEKRYQAKFAEEIMELFEATNKKDKEEEIGDILQIVDDVINFYGLDSDKIQEMKKQKKIKKGGFSKGIILDEVR